MLKLVPFEIVIVLQKTRNRKARRPNPCRADSLKLIKVPLCKV